jgi:hypothetical protein
MKGNVAKATPPPVGNVRHTVVDRSVRSSVASSVIDLGFRLLRFR